MIELVDGRLWKLLLPILALVVLGALLWGQPGAAIGAVVGLPAGLVWSLAARSQASGSAREDG